MAARLSTSGHTNGGFGRDRPACGFCTYNTEEADSEQSVWPINKFEFLKPGREIRRLRREFPGREILTHRIARGARIGLGCYLGPDTEMGAGAELGDYSYLNRGTILMSGRIGRFCSVGYYSQIGMFTHPLDYVSTSSRIYGQRSVLSGHSEIDEFPAPPEIGHDVWIGSHAHVLQGVCVATGAVIGAGAVVTRDVEPYAIVGGVPARPLGKRFDDESIALLLAWRWWEMPVAELEQWRDVLRSADWQGPLRERLRDRAAPGPARDTQTS